MRPQALPWPDGQILVTAGKTAEVVVISPTSAIFFNMLAFHRRSSDLVTLFPRTS
jgi:hypothetical protein